MIKDKSIFIRNIYYMLAYAFQVLKQLNYQEVKSENFQYMQDLFAAILVKGINQQLKQGLYREYTSRCDNLSVLRGKLNIPGTMRSRIKQSRVLVCEFDELSENNLFNQILKTTLSFLVRNDNVKKERREDIYRILPYFSGVDVLQVSQIPWRKLYFYRHNRNYEMLLNICWFVLDGLLQTDEQGGFRMGAFRDEHMEKLYEKFILEYYRRHHTYLTEANSSRVDWFLTEAASVESMGLLPAMQTDVTLSCGGRTLIIDAKYYGSVLQQRYEREKLNPGNLYQIFAYVKNRDYQNTGSVEGMLLYAKTDESISPAAEYKMGCSRIAVRTLDLNQEFPQIAEQLDKIAFDCFGVHELSNQDWKQGKEES